MSDYEYFLIEYVPSPLSADRVRIGLLWFDAAKHLILRRFEQDWTRVRDIHPSANIDLLRSFAEIFTPSDLNETAKSFGSEPIDEKKTMAYRRILEMRDQFSGAIQVAGPLQLKSDNPNSDFENIWTLSRS